MLEEDQIEPDPTAVNFIPCMCFVKRGVAKEQPEKVALTHAELAKVISETKAQLADEDDSDKDSNDGDDEDMDTVENNAKTGDEYNFDDYDNEDGTQVAAIGDIAVVDPNENLDDADDNSEAEDDLIKPTDNLLLVGHVDDDASSLEVYVYNEEEDSFYVHHDFLLPSFPLCIEWMNYDPEAKDEGNMCAIGCIEPIISIWDLDIQNSLEPAIQLGSKAKRKKGIPQVGHTDAVLDLSWNTNFPHILASGSVDRSVILWDLDEQKPHTTIQSFEEKVQAVKFHPTEAQMLLTGCCDGTVKLFDCRDPSVINTSFKKWSFNSIEIERVFWDPHNTNGYFVGLNNGHLHYCDVRRENESVWHVEAHSTEISGIVANPTQAGMLTTTSADGLMKVWRYDETTAAQLVHESELGIGRVQCANICPDNGFVIATGGDNKAKQLRVINVRDFEVVKRSFKC